MVYKAKYVNIKSLSISLSYVLDSYRQKSPELPVILPLRIGRNRDFNINSEKYGTEENFINDKLKAALVE